MIDLSLNSQLNNLISVPATDKSLSKFCNALGIKYNSDNCIKIKNFTTGINNDLCILIFSKKGIFIVGIRAKQISREESNPNYSPTKVAINDALNLLSNDTVNRDYFSGDISHPTREVTYTEYPFTGMNYLLPIKSISNITLTRPTHFRHCLVIESNGSKYHFSMSKHTLMFNLKLKHMSSNFASLHHIPFSIDTKSKN